MSLEIEFGQSTTRVVASLDTVVATGLKREAEEQGIDMSELIQQILEKHVMVNKLIAATDAMRMQLMKSLVERAVETAKRLCRNGEFGPDLTGRTLELCMSDEKWASDYEKYVKDSPYKHGNPLKGRINIELGWAIKNGVGATVAKTVDGKTKKVYVTGAIIQSYTALVSFDSKMVRDIE
ncbi:hypothetical protein [Mesorhizobium sp. M0870]|uniref:hypothetical protein n=1 Tax=Mesorhizobium sp. M0870 TaxID=2957016 RepID=UPI00333A83DF